MSLGGASSVRRILAILIVKSSLANFVVNFPELPLTLRFSMKTKEELEEIAKDIVDAIFTVHKNLGSGLLESAYQACLAYELTTRGHQVESGKKLPVKYKDVLIEAAFHLDLRIDGVILIENKAVQSLLPIHEAQLLTYLKLTDCRLGFLVNWNVTLIKDGIKRMVNKL